MRQWLPPGHLVWWLIEVVDALDVSGFEKRAKLGRAGCRPIAPRTLLAILIYGYALGERSSRRLERLCETDVAFRVLAGNGSGGRGPDHATLARFRQQHEQALEGLFTQVLVMCAKSGLGKLGMIAIDGTKIAADASKQANMSEKRLREQLAKAAAAAVREAAETDTAEDEEFGAARGDELPPEMAPGPDRAARIRALLDDLDAERAAEQQAGAQQAEQRADEQAARAEKYLARLADPNGPGAGVGAPPAAVDRVIVARLRLERELRRGHQRLARYQAKVDAAAAQGRLLAGSKPGPIEQHGDVRAARAQLAAAEAAAASGNDEGVVAGGARRGRDRIRNLTDPDSRLMKSSQGGWVQGFNAQLAVTDDQIVIAADLVQDGNDTRQLTPMMTAAQQAAELMIRSRTEPNPGEQVGTFVADAGYLSEANLTAEGPDRLIALGKSHALHRDARDSPAAGEPPPDATPTGQMGHRLRTPEGHALYARRGVTVEPVNGHLKDRHGLRRFSRRGLSAARSELIFTAMVANLLKIHRASTV
jgi:transposase